MTARLDPAAIDQAPVGQPFASDDCAWGSTRRMARAQFWFVILAACVGSGAFFGAVSAGGRPQIGAIFGLVIGGGVMLFEQGVIAPGVRRRLRQLPLVPGVILTEAAYIALILIGTAITGAALKATGMLVQSWQEAVVPTPIQILYALIVSGILITVNRMRELIGADVFRNLLLGRYYQPVEEERIFLFIDLIGSTAYAQQHGDVRAQAFLGAIFTALAEPVRRSRGTIDDYVGDMALVTWPLAVGITDARCVACVFSFLSAVARDRDRWIRDFGQVPQFRAALHGGTIVTAEVGLDRRKIAYFGDVVNTTGRLEGLCRSLDAPLLISADLLQRITALPGGVAAADLGTHAVRGRGEALSVFSLRLAPVLLGAAAPAGVGVAA